MKLFKKRNQPTWFIFGQSTTKEVIYFANKDYHYHWNYTKSKSYLFVRKEDAELVLELLRKADKRDNMFVMANE